MRIQMLLQATLLLAIAVGHPVATAAQQPKAASWKFAVSGDSRNCGDVVMPAIATGVMSARPLFYWHLGDFRKLSGIDEDIAHQPEHLAKPLSLDEYRAMAWSDFIRNQIAPFRTLPVRLGIGNHEMVAPKTRPEFIAKFRPWLDARLLRNQRLRDDPSAVAPQTYYHWVERGVDFINLDNATKDEFDSAQLTWFEKTLQSDSKNAAVHTLVVGMHEALPESISKGHGMNESEVGTQTGLRVYADLLKAQNDDHKRVYVLASHSHYFMDGTFNTEYWREHGGILPGWIIGTAGAQRYALPPEASAAHAATTDVYGYLLATAKLDGEIHFDFKELKEQDVPAAVTRRYTAHFVHWCFANNSATH